MLNRSRIAAAGVAALFALAGCASSGTSGGHVTGSPAHDPAGAAFPVTVHAANGAVPIAQRPTSIVSLSPTGTEMLFAIGAGSQVKAVDADSDYPANSPHTKLNAFQLNVEALVAYHPDLVVASNLTPAQLKQLGELHITVLYQPAATDLDQTYAELTQLGAATGHASGAAAVVASMKRQIAAIVSSTPKQHATYYYELDQTYYSETSATFLGQLLRMFGLSSIADSATGAAAAGGYPQLSAEFILKANPTYVFLADTRCCKQSAATVAKRPGWATMTAVRDGRIVTLDDDIASRWGPRVVELLRTVSQAIKQHQTTR